MFDNFDLNQLVVMIVPLLIGVTVHEVAHGYMAFKMGDPTAMQAGRLSLNPVRHLDWMGSFFLPLILQFSGAPFIFGYAKPVPVNAGNFYDFRKGTIFVSSAGVIANLLLAIVSGLCFQILHHFESFWYASILRPIILDLFHMLGYSVVINCVLAVFNLIPIPPLDGSRILAMFLPVTFRIQYERMERFGMVIIIFLLITDSLGKLMTFFLNPMVNTLLGR